MTAPFAFKRGPAMYSKPRAKRQEPELILQAGIVQFLTYALPPEYVWTADASGARTSAATAAKLKASGVKRGNPDLRILCPDGLTRYMETKPEGRKLTPEQLAFKLACIATGRDIWGLARSIEDAERHCLRWGIPLRCAISDATRYGVRG